MIILGKNERLKFDADRSNYSKEVQKIYDDTKTLGIWSSILVSPLQLPIYHLPYKLEL